MRYGVIYAKIIPPKGHKSEWVKYCHISSVLPKSKLLQLSQLRDYINRCHGGNIIIPFDINNTHPGCTTTEESVMDVAVTIYYGLVAIWEVEDGGFGVPCVRCVFTTGELDNVNVESTHRLDSTQTMINLGRYLDSSDEPGMFKV